tara:strand:+ start:5107 stop:5358 length:252 start_codon:yes stop_codon:yes gene_type:complete
MEIALGVIVLIGIFIVWEVVKYSNQQKQIRKYNERTNSQDDVRSCKKEKTSKHSKKAVENKVSNNDKPRKSYKKKKKSVKDKN